MPECKLRTILRSKAHANLTLESVTKVDIPVGAEKVCTCQWLAATVSRKLRNSKKVSAVTIRVASPTPEQLAGAERVNVQNFAYTERLIFLRV